MSSITASYLYRKVLRREDTEAAEVANNRMEDPFVDPIWSYPFYISYHIITK